MPKDRDIPAFLFYPDDFSSDGKVEAMSTLEVGAYILLLCKAWRERPPGSLPDDDCVLARWTRLTSDEWQAAKARVLAAFLLQSDGRWHQERMRREYSKAAAIRNKRAEAGSKGGRPKANEKQMVKPGLSKPIGIGNGVSPPLGDSEGGTPPPPLSLNAVPLAFALSYFEGLNKQFADEPGFVRFTATEVREAWNDFESAKDQETGAWYHWNGKRPIGDWRAALESQILWRRGNRSSKYENNNKPHRENPRNAGMSATPLGAKHAEVFKRRAAQAGSSPVQD